MLRALFCMSCCGVPPTTRSSNKRKSSSNLNLRPPQADSSKRALQDPLTGDEKNPEGDKTKFITLAASEKDQLLATQTQTYENYGTKLENAQGKLSSAVDSAEQERALDRPHAVDDLDSLAASASINKQLKQEQRQLAASERYHDIRLEASLSGDEERSVSPGSSTDMGPYTESRQAPRAGLSVDAPDDTDNQDDDTALEKLTRTSANEQGNQQTVTSSKSAPRNVPTSTTKIGDYARIEYSPVEDLDSVTTMSYSRLGSERGTRSQAGSTLSRQNSLGRTTGGEGGGGGATTDGSLSRRSSQGGIESTSLSFASQLSNEQFQQNLTNMLESVNSNYPTFDTIGLPLGPPIDATTETTKTSPETPGAALTSASQDSLSDASFNGANNSPKLSRPTVTLRSNQSSSGALVNDSTQDRVNLEEMAELAKPAPLAMAEDERLGSPPYTSVVTSKSADNTKAPGDRVGSPQSFTTTTSGGLTNPTPTPSEISTGSGKTKKKLRAKALFKRLKLGSKKKNKDDDV